MGKQSSSKQHDVLSASEIGQYLYCSLSWHLQRCGYEPDSPLLQVGTKAHRDLGITFDILQGEVQRSRRFATIGYLLLLGAIIGILYVVIMWL